MSKQAIEGDQNLTLPPGTSLPASSPLWINLPVEPSLIERVGNMLSGGNIVLSEISELVLSDPIFTLEIIGFANRHAGPGTNSPVTGVNAALFRIGAQGVFQLFENLSKRPPVEDPLAVIEFRKLRTLGRHNSAIARLVAAVTSRENIEDARTLGLFTVLGQMLACYKFGRTYAALALELSRPSLVYRLTQDHRFDVRAIQLAYLRSRAIPQSLFFVFDREYACKAPGQAELRFVVDSAYELVENYEHAKFDRYRPAVELPGKSSLRLLGVDARQHEQIYEECVEFFEFEKRREEDLGALNGAAPLPAAAQPAPPVPEVAKGDDVPEIDYIEAGDAAPAQASFEFSEKAQNFFAAIETLFQAAKKTDELLSKLLTLLVTVGPYKRAALLVVQPNRKLAVVHTLAGQSVPSGNIEVHDPISPLALISTKVRSFNATEVVDYHAPFGISAYAMSPLKVKNLPPVLLYVDCGNERCLPFEGRKIFRLVVGLLNNSLSKNSLAAIDAAAKAPGVSAATGR